MTDSLSEQSVMVEVYALEMLAKTRWGDVPTSTEVMLWNNGEFQIKVFHTIGRVSDGEPMRVDLIYSSWDDSIVERVDHIQVQQIVEEHHREEL